MRSSIQKVVGTLPRERRTQRVSFSHLPAAVCRVYPNGARSGVGCVRDACLGLGARVCAVRERDKRAAWGWRVGYSKIIADLS